MIQFDAKVPQELSSLIPDNKSNDVEKSSFQSRLEHGFSKGLENKTEQKQNGKDFTASYDLEIELLSSKSNSHDEMDVSSEKQESVSKIDNLIDGLILNRSKEEILNSDHLQNRKSDISGSRTDGSSEFHLNSQLHDMEYKGISYEPEENVKLDNYLNSSKVYSFIQSATALGQFETVATAKMENVNYHVGANEGSELIKGFSQIALNENQAENLMHFNGIKKQILQPFNQSVKDKVVENSESKVEKSNYKSKMANFFINSEKYALTYFKIVDSGFDYRVYYRDFNNSLTVEQLVQYISYFSSSNNKKAHLVYNGVKRALHGY